MSVFLIKTSLWKQQINDGIGLGVLARMTVNGHKKHFEDSANVLYLDHSDDWETI